MCISLRKKKQEELNPLQNPSSAELKGGSKCKGILQMVVTVELSCLRGGKDEDISRSPKIECVRGRPIKLANKRQKFYQIFVDPYRNA